MQEPTAVIKIHCGTVGTVIDFSRPYGMPAMGIFQFKVGISDFMLNLVMLLL